jgi:hypothetical protein
METLELAGETLALLERDAEDQGNWYTNKEGEEIHISDAELRGDPPTYWEW